jgi:MFS transporter, DHA2 family, multidrug resistance protein
MEHPPAKPSLGELLGFSAMALGMFIALLDIQIVAGSLKEIQGGLSASHDEMSSIQTAYLIAEIVMIPISGWLAKVVSTRWLFTTSAVLFTLASLCCGLAWSIESMIVFRVMQGFAGAPMIPLAFSAGFALFKGPKAAIIPAVLGVMGTLAPTLGPTIGGWITETYSWRHLFYVNVPPGLLIIATVPFYVRVDKPDLSFLKGVDWFSIPFIAIAMGGLGYVLEEGVRRDWFADSLIAALTAASLASFCVVVWRGLTHPNPVLDIGAMRIRNFALGCIFAFVVGVGNYASIYILPLFLAEVRDFNSLDIGKAVFVTGAAQLCATMAIAATANRVDQRLLLAAGFAGYALSLFMMTPLTNQWQGPEFFWTFVLRGAASMAVIIPVTSFALSGLPTSRLPMASGLFNLMRNLGGAVGIATTGIILQQRQSLHYSRLSESVTAFHSEVALLQTTTAERFGTVFSDLARSDHAALLQLTQMARREALVLTIADIFWVMAALFLAAFVLVPLLRR